MCTAFQGLRVSSRRGSCSILREICSGRPHGGKTTCGCGVLFKLVPSSGNWTETVLYTFNGTTDGEFPNPVILDGAGNLFGTAANGGSHKFGTIFKFAP